MPKKIVTMTGIYTAISAALWKFESLSTDQTAQILKKHPLHIRPRFTEMKDSGLIEKCGLRANDDTGRPLVFGDSLTRLAIFFWLHDPRRIRASDDNEAVVLNGLAL